MATNRADSFLDAEGFLDESPRQRSGGSADQFLDAEGFLDTAGAEPSRPPSTTGQGRLSSATSSFARGVGETVSGLPKSIALMGAPDPELLRNLERIDRGEPYRPTHMPAPGAPGVTIDPYEGVYAEYEKASPEERQRIRQSFTQQAEAVRESPLYQAGNQIDEWFAENFPTNPEYQDEFWSAKVPQALGSATGFLAAAGITRGATARLGATARTVGTFGAPAGLGSSLNRSQQFEDALESGADIATALEAAELGALIGVSEAVPIGNLFNRLDKGSGGQVRRYLSRAIRQGTEEAVQEAFSGVMNAAVAQKLYDPERGIWTMERAEEGAVGFTTGAILETVMTLALPGRRRGGGAQAGEGGVPEGAVPAETLLGEEIQPEGVREQTVQQTPPPTPEDEASPIPTDIIQEGKAALQDAGGALSASEILENAGFPPVETEVTLTTREGGTIRGTVVDAFDQDGMQGAKIRLENGSVVAETFEQLQGRMTPTEQAQQEAAPAPPPEAQPDDLPVRDVRPGGAGAVAAVGPDTQAGSTAAGEVLAEPGARAEAPIPEPGARVPDADLPADAQPALTPPAEPAVEAPARQPVARRDVPDAEDTAVTAAGREVPVRYAVVEASDLAASQLDDGRVNPDYPTELQPRDRSRAVSQQQIQDIAQRLNPRLVDRSPRASDGAPIITDDGVVESGNGRILAIRRAYAEGLETSQQYRDYLAERGYPVEGMNQPVLVRVREGEMEASERQAFTREANERDTLGMSATERAMADAAALPDQLLEIYRGGDVDTAANRPFVRRFIESAIGRNEQADMIAADGAMSQEAIRRIEGALLAKAYGDADLVASLIESADTNIKAIGGALMDVSAGWAQMRADAAAGQIDPTMDQTDRLLEAVRLVQRARREQRNVAEFVSQTDMLSGEAIHPAAELFLSLFFRNKQSFTQPAGREKIADALRFYVSEAERAQLGADLLGDTASPERILETARDRQYGPETAAEQQQDLLAQPAGRPGERGGEPSEGRPEQAQPEARPDTGAEGPRAGEEGAGAAEAVAPEAAAEAPLRVEDYTDKSLIVRGETRENIDRIKAAGRSAGVRALWNRKAQGWVFPKSKESQVREALADLIAPSAEQPSLPERRDETQREIYDRRLEDITDPAELRAYAEELRAALMTDERTGLGSNRAWINRTPKAYVASIDLDSLKWVNDNMGHDAGDRMIAAVGDAMREAGIAEDAYHVSGDEFYAEADSEQQLQEAMARARDHLQGVTIEGNGLTYTGPGFSYGVGTTIDQAEQGLHGDKTEREEAGERTTRGDRPRGVADAPQIQEQEPAPADREEAPADREGERAERPEPILTEPSPSVTLEGERTPETADDGVQRPVPPSDAPAGAQDVQPVAPDRGPGRAPSAEVGGGAPDVQRTDRERAEAPERVPERSVGEGGRGTGVRDTDRVPAGRPERTERPAGEAARVKGTNYQIEPGTLEETRGRVQKARDNIRAIELMRQIEAEGRPATRAEQEQLARYVGWGGLKGAFPDSQGKFEKGLETAGKQLQELLSETEYATARRSLQYAHYTAENVARTMWEAARRLGFQGGKVFEPGMGVGNFPGLMPPDVAPRTDYHGLELDHTTARIARLLYPRWGVRQDDFTRAPLPKDTYDLVIGNPPFADIAIRSDSAYPQGFLLHDYFFAKSLDAVRPGGLLAFISSAGTMNKIDAGAREYMADRADLVAAIRLPGTAFEQSAGTSVTTDIIILRKRLPDEAAGDRSWTETTEVTLPNKEGRPTKGRVNSYFVDNPDMVIGEEGFFDPLYEGRYAVRAPKDFDLDAALRQALGRLPENVMGEWQDTTDRAEIDFGTAERKEGSFYIGRDGQLMQQSEGVGRPVERRGKGVTGGRTLPEMERMKALVPIRDALRAVYAADLNDDTANAETARKRLNESYDAFVERFGPINKANFQYRRPTVIQQESARAEAREEARFTGTPWREGDFDPTSLIEQGASLQQIARARKEAREKAEKAGREFDEGSFDPSDMPDIVIEKRPNIDPFMDDPESYRLRAVEKYNDESGEASKSAVFSENIITREREPEINSVNDAVLHVLNRYGRLDITEVARAAGLSESEAIEELGDRIFRLPGTDNQWVVRDEYLSGNVRRKLRQARAAAARDPSLQRNVDALEAGQPAPLPPSEINANLGMPWIPTDVIETFGTDALGLGQLRVRYTPALGLWDVSGDTGSVAAVSTWGTDDRPAPALIQDALNRQDPRIYRETWVDGKKSRELDAVATEATQDKVREIKQRFSDWVWSDPTRARELAELYNEEYNNLVVREYNGDYLTTPGISATWSWRPHQTRVIARIIQSGNTYMAHSVGAGKTSAMIGAGMEMRRLGLVRKPMYAVPNHMLGQFTKEFYEQYPTARIAVADERRFHTDRRKQFIANVANDDLDAVIITHSAFGMIPISDAFQDALIQEQIDQYRNILEDVGKDQETRITRSRLEKQIERLEQRLSGRAQGRRDQVFTFEEMGVDFLFMDEAHLFRKLDFATKMSNVKGISPEGSKGSWDLFVKTRYLETINPGRNLVLASGTPVTNTMAELFTVSRYLQPAELRDRGLEHFDAWAGAYGDTVTNLEQTPDGGYKPVTRFAKFVNVPELSNMVRQNMDVVTSRQLEQYVTRPSLKNGKRQMNLAEKGEALDAYQADLASRMEAIANRKGPPQPGDDIILNVINDGRHAAIDMRLVDPDLPSDPGSKLNLLIDNVYRVWEQTKRQPFHTPEQGGYSGKPVDKGPAAQMIFANLGLSGTRGFAVPDYIRAELVRRGVPKNQIAFIADYKTHVAKQRLFNDMNEGKVRVLIGSTAKMATGVNAQRRLYAVHNLDPLWYPADDEQRNGRILRQGNMNPEIEIHDYSTKGTYDSTMWGLMETKARFIQGFFEGDPNLRDMEDLGEASQYEQAKAITTADPRLIELTDLRQQLERAQRRKAAFEREQYATEQRVASARDRVRYHQRRIPDIEADIARRIDTRGDNFRATVDGRTYTDRVEAGDVLLGRLDILKGDAREHKDEKIGEIGGFDVMADVWGPQNDRHGALVISRAGGHQTEVRVSESARGTIQSLENALRGIENELTDARNRVQQGEATIREFEPQIGQEFTGQAEIDRLTEQVRNLERELAPKQEEKPPAQEGDTEGQFALRDEFAADAETVTADLSGRLKQLGIADKVALNLRDRIQAVVDGQVSRADARYLNRVIEVSLESQDAARALNHEIIHALRDLGVVRSAEWRALERAARADTGRMETVRQRYGLLNLTEDQLVEETVAEMYVDWAAGQTQTGGFLRRAFERIRDFLQALGRALTGRGYHTADSVFRSIERGDVGRRQPRDAQGRFERFALSNERLNDPTARGGAQARQRATNQWLGSQPLDQAFRLPWHLFGGINEHGEWNLGLKLSQKTASLIQNATFSEEGRFVWVNPYLEKARAGLLDRYGLAPDYVERERQRGLEERKITAQVPEIMGRLREANVGTAEAKVLQAVLTGEAVADADMARLAEPIRNAIDDMGAEAVQLGLISAEAFERNRGAYLHRVYLKHENDQGGLVRWVSRVASRRRRKIIGNQFKGRGLWIEVDRGRLMRRVPGFREGERGQAVQGERFQVFDLVEGTDQETLRGISPRSQRRVMNRIFLPDGAPVPEGLTGYVDRGTWEVRGTRKGNIVLWRDFTKPERESMGEIVDARYTIAKTYMQMAHDLSTGRFFRDIALNEDWSTRQEPRRGTWADAQEYNRHWADPEVEWVRVPTAMIAKSQTKRYGALAGRYVRAEIWRDLHELERMQKAGVWNTLLTQWKLNKTARSPVVHMNNIMSNVVLMDLADVRAVDLARGIRAMIREDQDYQEALDNGAFGSDMVAQELRKNTLQPLLEEIQREMQGGQEAMEAKFGLVGKVADAIWSRAKNLDRKMTSLYQLEDEVFRMATFMRKRALGFEPSEAALQARDQFLNYDIRAPWVNAARRSVLPFISYTYRAVPVVAHSVMLRPWKLAKYATLAYVANALAYMVTEGDEDEERRSLDEIESGHTWIGAPRMIRMPWSDAHGNPLFLDIRRWIPAGDVFDMNQGHAAFAIPAPLQFGGPLMLGAELALNKQAFTGQEITNDRTDDWWDKTSKVADWAWKSWMPSAAWVPGSWYWEKIGDAMSGARDPQGRPYSLATAAASSVGVKLKPQDVKEAFFWKGVEFNRIEQELRAQMRRLHRDYNRGLLSREAKERREQKIIDKMENLGKERERTF